MKMKKTRNNKNTIRFSFFHSMSTTAILFMSLLFLGTSTVFFHNFFIRERQDALHQLDYISRQFQFYLNSTDNYCKTIISSNEVQTYIKKYNKIKNSVLSNNTVKEQIRQIIQSTSFIHSVSLYSPEGKIILSTEPYPLTKNIFSSQSLPKWSIGTKHTMTAPASLIKVLSYTQPFYDISTGKLLGYVEISIPESEISEIYKEQNIENRLFMIDSNGYIQSSSGIPKLNSIYSYGNQIFKTLDSGSNFFFTGKSFVFFEYFPVLNWYIISETPLLSFLSPLLMLFYISLLIVLFTILLCIYVSYRVSHKITSPLSYLILHTQTIKEGNWVPIKEIPCNDELSTVFKSFNSMIDTQTKMKDDLLKAEKLKRQLSLNLLQQQVNPHFLYNTLDNICSLAELDEKEKLMQLVMNLSSFYRTSLNSGKMYITIGEELAISRAYLKIMEIRYFKKFDFTIICPEYLKDYICIKLLFQPIVENSIYHGIKELSRHGHIKILVEDMGDLIRFTIEDNGKGFLQADHEKIWTESKNHFGVKNIQQRIQLYYGVKYGLIMSSSEWGGCKTVITIPKQEENQCL